MIPKIIHYIWLNDGKKPLDVKFCISSWKKIFPDYKIKCWDLNSFDINRVPFVKEAIKQKKWAFAADYIRLYALYTEGGIYLDTDILLLHSFDELLKYCSFLSAVESFISTKKCTKNLYLDEYNHRKPDVKKVPGLAIQAAFMVSIPKHPFLLDCMSWYENKNVIDNVIFTFYDDDFVANDVYAQCAEKYGFMYKDIEQWLSESMHLVPTSVIASSYKTKQRGVYAIHCCNGSWRNKIIFKIKRIIKYIFMRFF